MRDILAEIRGIHDDMRVTQTTQILLTEFEMQQSVVNRATENVDSARGKLLEIQQAQKVFTSGLERTEERLTQTSDANERKHIEEQIESLKPGIAELKAQEHSRTTTLQQMEHRLQTAQDRLQDIENELNAIIARLPARGK